MNGSAARKEIALQCGIARETRVFEAKDLATLTDLACGFVDFKVKTLFGCEEKLTVYTFILGLLGYHGIIVFLRLNHGFVRVYFFALFLLNVLAVTSCQIVATL